ncbi:MAG: hypothetical protein WDO56_26070 [Gammaproteobacteria bacterium]
MALWLGLFPVAAMALGASDGTTTAAPAGCTNPTMQPLGVPLEPQAETMKGAPYSGVGTSEVVTTLADGNRITRTNTMRYFRDNAGRMRTEYQLAAIGPFVPAEAQSIVTITDPVAGRRYVLHPSLKRAEEFKLVPATSGARAAAAGAIFVQGTFTSVGDMPRTGAPSTALMPSATPGRLSMPSPRANRGTDHAPTMMTPSFTGAAPPGVERGVVSNGAPAGSSPPNFDVLYANPHGAGTPGCTGPSGARAPKAESIGERRIEGLKVTGSRLELTIDAGTVGNEQPITVRTDQWFSPDLGVVVSSTNNDPMIGETTYRLEQINRVEPDASLFVVPADYTKNAVGF